MMKILICLIALTISNTCYADVVVKKSRDNTVTAKTVCIDGYLFAVVFNGSSYIKMAASITQVFGTVSSTSRPQPVRCGR